MDIISFLFLIIILRSRIINIILNSFFDLCGSSWMMAGGLACSEENVACSQQTLWNSSNRNGLRGTHQIVGEGRKRHSTTFITACQLVQSPTNDKCAEESAYQHYFSDHWNSSVVLTVRWANLKGAQVWDFRPIFYYISKSYMGRWLEDWRFFYFFFSKTTADIRHFVFLRMLSVR